MTNLQEKRTKGRNLTASAKEKTMMSMLKAQKLPENDINPREIASPKAAWTQNILHCIFHLIWDASGAKIMLQKTWQTQN
jgi:hypothetical protein